MDRNRLAQGLREICGARNVVTDPHALAVYRSDGLTREQVRPPVAVLPGSPEEVQQVVSLCHQQGLPWVTRGAGTGLAGGALPHPDGLLIVTSRLRRIISVNLADAEIVVEPGVTTAAAARAVAPTHIYPPDPFSDLVCTVGGNVGVNAGGAHCFKYGITTNYVTGLDVVLPDGSLAQLRAGQPGYDLLGAFVGSEGTLGIAVRIHLRLLPAPESVRTVLALFEDAAAAAGAVSEILAAAIVPCALELMDAVALRAAERAVPGGYPLDAGAALLIELDGPLPECVERLDQLLGLCTRAGAREFRVAADGHERERLWRTRKAAFPAVAGIAPACIAQDGVIPRTQLASVVSRIEALAKQYGLTVATVLHAADGNLHPLICYDPAIPGQSEQAEALSAEIVGLCVSLGGSISGEHGVGVDKLRHMPAMFDAADLDAFARLRQAFDPDAGANPGKLLPLSA